MGKCSESKFTKPLSFLRAVSIILEAMFDRLGSCVPPCVTPVDTVDCGFNPKKPNPYSNYVYGVLEATSAALWLLSRVKGEGIGDIRVGFLEPAVYEFMLGRLGDGPETPIPDCTVLAHNFIDTYVED